MLDKKVLTVKERDNDNIIFNIGPFRRGPQNHGIAYKKNFYDLLTRLLEGSLEWPSSYDWFDSCSKRGRPNLT
jgi:hypothetical protein